MNPELLKFLELTFNGVNTGVLYGLIAIGYTMVYGIILLINFAHGEVCMLGAMFTFTLIGWFLDPSLAIPGFAFFAFVALAASADGGFGIFLDWVAYKPLRGSSRLSVLITAIGMSLLLQNLAVIGWDASAKLILVPSWFHESLFTVGGRFGIRVTYFHLMVWVVTFASMAALYVVVMKTRMGMAMRACAQNPTAASLMGIQLNKVVAVTFFIGSVLGAIGGIAVAINKGSFDYQIGLYVGVVAFAAAVLGGIGDIRGAMLGGLIIGIVEAWAAGYLNDIPHPFGFLGAEGGIHTGYKEAVGFCVLIVIIIVRPQGLLGSRGGDRA